MQSMKRFFGGADRIRTGDLMNAIHALCQLSYNPTVNCLDKLFILYRVVHPKKISTIS